MKKLIAILFLSLICLATVSGKLYFWESGYELIADSEERETDNKDAKKEIKEFTAHPHKKAYAVPSLIYSYKLYQALFFPHPVLDRHTPPPDLSC